MAENMIIIGAGPGLSRGIAEKFGEKGYRIGLISRHSEKLETQVAQLKKRGVTAFYATADAHDKTQLTQAIKKLREKMGSVNTLVYNAAILKRKNIMDEATEELLEDFKISVVNAQHSVKTVFEDLKANQGTVLLTGGGLALKPNSEMGSVCLGKAALRNLAFQLNETLAKENIFAGTVTVCDQIKENSKTHSPKLIADKFWQMHNNRSDAEIQY